MMNWLLNCNAQTTRGPNGVTNSLRWHRDGERLDRALAESGLVRSRSHASDLIEAGSVLVDGEVVMKAGRKVAAGATLEVRGADHYVSRGAYKLLAALDAFGIDPADRLALDLGASTGGFTQVLLERGAREVLAIDVGHDQLARQLRDDPRVRVVEGCNARNLDATTLAELTGTEERPSLVVADLSFISLTLVLPAIARCVGEGAELALLIKPQFEVGRVKGGVVTNPLQWAEAIRTVLRAAAEQGFAARGLESSPIEGGEGNREFIVRFVSAPSPDPQEWEGRVRALCGIESEARQPHTAEEGSAA